MNPFYVTLILMFLFFIVMIASFFLGVYAVHLASMRNSESNEPFLFKNGKVLKVVDVLSNESWDRLGEFNDIVNQAFEENYREENEENVTNDGKGKKNVNRV